MTPTRLTLALTLALTTTLTHAAPQWTWEAGKQTNNGEITLKSTDGSTSYTGTQNPTGAVAKSNQTASTQPPTVIIQATSGSGTPFNYKDDCWVFDLAGAGQANNWFIGAGKIDTVGPKFTGVMGWYGGGGSSYGAGGKDVMAALLGVGAGGANNYNPKWCGSDASCAWNHGYNAYYSTGVVGVAALPILTYQKCYP